GGGPDHQLQQLEPDDFVDQGTRAAAHEEDDEKRKDRVRGARGRLGLCDLAGHAELEEGKRSRAGTGTGRLLAADDGRKYTDRYARRSGSVERDGARLRRIDQGHATQVSGIGS